MKADESISDSVAINEVQLLLAEQRTSLSVMRTGIAILVLPVSVVSLLIATSKYYDTASVMQLLVPLAGLCIALLLLGGYLVVHSTFKLHRFDRLIHKVTVKHSAIAEFLDER